MNVVALIGRLGQDPDIRYFDDGKRVAKFSLAISEGKDRTTWLNIEAWDKTADVIGQYCRKGKQVGVNGSIRVDEWEDKTTRAKRRAFKILAARVELLGNKGDSQGVSEGRPLDEYDDIPL
ncbi:MAG: single-stranded DNA-binding protein [Cyanobacteria bacterium J06635_1]